MITQETLKGRWNEIRGKLKQQWGGLTDEELASVEGNIDQLVGLVQQKTGESREAIEHYLERAAEDAGTFVQQAGERVKQSARQMRDSVEHGYRETEEMVRSHPTQSVVVAFGTGMLLGVIVGLVFGRND